MVRLHNKFQERSLVQGALPFTPVYIYIYMDEADTEFLKTKE